MIDFKKVSHLPSQYLENDNI